MDCCLISWLPWPAQASSHDRIQHVSLCQLCHVLMLTLMSESYGTVNSTRLMVIIIITLSVKVKSSFSHDVLVGMLWQLHRQWCNEKLDNEEETFLAFLTGSNVSNIQTCCTDIFWPSKQLSSVALFLLNLSKLPDYLMRQRLHMLLKPSQQFLVHYIKMKITLSSWCIFLETYSYKLGYQSSDQK